MTVFIASKPVSLTGAGIASAFGIFDTGYVRVLHTAAEYKVEGNAHTVALDFKSAAGHPFQYLGGPLNPPTGGNIATLAVDTGPNHASLTLAYKFSNMSVSVAAIGID